MCEIYKCTACHIKYEELILLYDYLDILNEKNLSANFYSYVTWIRGTCRKELYQKGIGSINILILLKKTMKNK